MSGNVLETLAQLGFTQIALNVTGRRSVSEFFPDSDNGCGIYVLHFSNGEYYVGQSIDVVKRHAQHQLRFTDIAELSFIAVPEICELNSQEERVIRAIEALGIHLRNKMIVKFSYGETVLSKIIPTEHLLWWCNEAENELIGVERQDDEPKRRRYARAYAHLQKLPDSDSAITIARMFVQKTIPAPSVTESNFWTCTREESSNSLYFRINVGAQQTFCVVRNNSELQYNIFLPRSNVNDALENRKGFFQRLYALWHPTINGDYRVVSGGQKAGGIQDQVIIETESAEVATQLLSIPGIILACRKFHVSLMQKGPCLWNRYHCLDLADRLLESEALPLT